METRNYFFFMKTEFLILSTGNILGTRSIFDLGISIFSNTKPYLTLIEITLLYLKVLFFLRQSKVFRWK